MEAATEALEHFDDLEKKRTYYVRAAKRLAVRALLQVALDLDEEDEVSESLEREVMGLIDTSRTQAFQAALVLTALEASDYVRRHAEGQDPGEVLVELTEMVHEYGKQVSAFFRPETRESLERLLRALRGSAMKPDSHELEPESNLGFREVVVPGELQPDAWPKFRYLFLGLWTPSSETALDYVDRHRAICRREVIQALYRRLVREAARAAGVTEDHLAMEYREEAFEQAFARLRSLVEVLSGEELSRADMEDAVAEASPDDEEEDA